MANERVTKNEAVRLAIVELGKDASRSQIQGFVKERFGYELSPNHVSAARVAAFRKLAAAEVPQPAAANEEAGKPVQAPATKIEAVRLALAELGRDATPTAIQGFVKERFGVAMTEGHAKTAKGIVRREAAKKKASKKPAMARPTVAAEPQVPAVAAKPAPAAAADKGVNLGDILALRGLLDRVGADELRTLVDVMAK